MNSCTYCQGRFGLVRYTHFQRAFCSKKCKTDFYANQGKKLAEARRRWLEYLYPHSVMARRP